MDSRTEVILKTVLAGGDVSSITPKSRIEELLIALGQTITDISQPSEEEIATAVNNWLTEHKSELDVIPDGSITQEKLSRAIYNDVDSLSDIVSTNTEEISKLNETIDGRAIVCNATGQSIQITDGSNEPIRSMEVHSKNLMPMTFSSTDVYAKVIDGVANIANNSSERIYPTINKSVMLKPGNYTFVLYASDIVGDWTHSTIEIYLTPGYDRQIISANASDCTIIKQFKITETVEKASVMFALWGNTSYKARYMLLKGAYTADTIPPYEPYADKVDVTVTGKNFYSCDKLRMGRYYGTTGGWNGASSNQVSNTNMIKVLDNPNIGYYINFKSGYSGTKSYCCYCYDKDKNFLGTVGVNSTGWGYAGDKFYLKSGTEYVNFTLLVSTSPNPTDVSKYSDVIFGLYDATDKIYEPYIGSQFATIDTVNQTGWEDLHTYNGTTNILPSVMADLSVDYVADTKEFIVNQIQAVANAIVATAE